jgi:hypothetical protein
MSPGKVPEPLEEEAMNEALDHPNEIPKDVRDFASKQGVEKHLPAVVELTRRVYPGWEPTLKLEHDPEIPEQTWIVVGIRTTEMEFPQLREAHRAWRAGLQEISPGLSYWVVYRTDSVP